MNLSESLRVAFEGLAANRLRSALTMLGVIFGVGAVIAAVSMTEGAKAATLKQFERFGTNVLTVRSGPERRGGVRSAVGSAQDLTTEDARAIAEQCPSVVAVAPQVSTSAQIKAGNQNTNTRVIGTTEAFPSIRDITMSEGTWFSAADVKARSKVAILGPTVVEELFGAGASVAGKQMKIKSVTFRVLGQYKAKGEAGGPFSQDDQVMVPLTTAMFRLIGRSGTALAERDSVNAVDVQFADMKLADKARGEVEELLRERHKIRPGAEDDFRVMSAADFIAGAEEANRVLTLLFGSIAAVSLLVGGIGIMNIMLVSVTERTREIGLRKAIGATPRDILLQFLIEAVTLSMLGGGVGVGVGIGLAYALRLMSLNTAVSIPWVVIAFSFAAFVGVFFGLLPARKAATLEPVEALRYE
jgi:putative ABC transport system permease protein